MLLKNGFNFYKEIVPKQDLSFSFRLRTSGSNVSNMRNPVSLVWLVLSESSSGVILGWEKYVCPLAPASGWVVGLEKV